jgi:class 3 adenylate cyclase
MGASLMAKLKKAYRTQYRYTLTPLGLEATQHLRRTFFAQAQETVERDEGTFKFFGSDGFLMFFGIPVAHEDHARRAVLAALRLQKSMHDGLATLKAEPAAEMTVRIGIHTGPIAIRSLSGHQPAWSITQTETTTLAFWLHYHAKAGVLLTTRATIPLVQDAVAYAEYGPVRIPRYTEPIMTYQIYEQSYKQSIS